MKWLFFSFPLILLLLCIENNGLSSNHTLNEEKRESYEACMRLKRKASYFNLKCEHLLDNIHFTNSNNNVNKNININKGVKNLPRYESNTRKLNKMEEIKLRNLIAHLSTRNKLRKD